MQCLLLMSNWLYCCCNNNNKVLGLNQNSDVYILKQGKNLQQNNPASSFSKAVFSPKTLEPWLGPLGRSQSGVLWFPLSLICSWPLNGSLSRPANSLPPWKSTRCELDFPQHSRTPVKPRRRHSKELILSVLSTNTIIIQQLWKILNSGSLPFTLTDLDWDVYGLYHQRAEFRRSLSLSAGWTIGHFCNLKDSNNGQLVEGRCAAVYNDPCACDATVITYKHKGRARRMRKEYFVLNVVQKLPDGIITSASSTGTVKLFSGELSQ